MCKFIAARLTRFRNCFDVPRKLLHYCMYNVCVYMCVCVCVCVCVCDATCATGMGKYVVLIIV